MFPLVKRLGNINNLLYKRVLVALESHGLANELQNATQWYDSEKSRLESELKSKSKDGVLVNLDAVIEDYFEGTKSKSSQAIASLFGGI